MAPKQRKVNMRHKLETATIWSDASPDEEEENTVLSTPNVGEIELEPEEDIKTSLRILRKHDKFDRYLRDTFHFLLCKNNLLNKPLREVYVSIGSPFSVNIGLAVLVEQVISRMSWKAIFKTKTIRKTKDVCDFMAFLFFQRVAKLSGDFNLLIMELCVIAFELLLYCIIQEMFVVPMKDLVNVCTDIYRKMLQPEFEDRHHCWHRLRKYAKGIYSEYFIDIRLCYKTLGYPYDIFVIPDPWKRFWKAKIVCITDTFFNFVPLGNFRSVLKDYNDEVAKLDLSADPHFKTRVIMRKADRRKKYREEMLKAETLGGAETDTEDNLGVGDAGPETSSSTSISGFRSNELESKSETDTDVDLGVAGGVRPKTFCGAKPKIVSNAPGSGFRTHEKESKTVSEVDLGMSGGARPKTYGGARPKTHGGTRPKTVSGTFGSNLRPQEKEKRAERLIKHKNEIVRQERKTHIECIKDGEYGAISGIETVSSGIIGSSNDEEYGAIGCIGTYDGEYSDGAGISNPKHEKIGKIVSDKPKQSSLRTSRNRSSSRVRFDEETLSKPVTYKPKLKPKMKKVPAYIPQEVMSDLELFRICDDEKNSDDEKFFVPQLPKPIPQPSQEDDQHGPRIDPILNTPTVESKDFAPEQPESKDDSA